MIKAHIHKNQLYLAVLTLLVLLSGCDNNESTSTQQSTNQSTTITGTAATGLAIDGLVTATSSSGNMSEQVGINTDGQFSVEIEGEPPYLLMAQSTDGSITLFSIGFEAGTTNITPFSHQVLQDLYSGKQLAAVFNNWSVENTSVDEQSVSKSMVSLVNATASEFINANVETTNFNALRSQFITNHTEFDAVLDATASSLPTGTLAVDGSISYAREPDGLDGTGTPTLPASDSSGDLTFVGDEEGEVPDLDSDIGIINPTSSSSGNLTFIGDEEGEIPDLDSDIRIINPTGDE